MIKIELEKKNFFYLPNWPKNKKNNLLFSSCFKSQFERNKIFYKSNKLKNLIFCELISLIKKELKIDYKKKEWMILMNPWFNFFFNIIFNRYSNVIKILKYKNFKNIIIEKNKENYYKVINSTEDFFKICDEESFNSEIFHHIFQLFKEKKIKIKLKRSNKSEKVFKSLFVYNIINNIIHFFSRNNNIFLQNCYFGKWREVFLNLRLMQLPYLSVIQRPLKDNVYNHKLRENLIKKFKKKNDSKFIKICKNMIIKYMPKSYLEGFGENMSNVSKLALPNKPNLIVTSTHYDTNDSFKFWLIKNIRRGAKFYSFQHGAGYLTIKYKWWGDITDTADIFFCWGKKKKLLNFKTIGYTRLISKRLPSEEEFKKYILLVSKENERKYQLWDVEDDNYSFFQKNRDLLLHLPKEILKKTYTRMHPVDNFNIEIKKKTEFYFNKSNIITTDIDYNKIIKHTKLFIFNYDATDFYRNIYYNIPSIIYLPFGFENIRASALNDYKKLYHSGIIFTDPKILADKIISIDENVNFWWQGKKVQDAINFFSKKYCIKNTKLMTDIFQIVKKFN
jgi:putative transferase (TIGR04331 family)